MKMKKKIWHGLFVLLCLFILMLPAKASSIPAERQKPLLVDDAGLLTTEESTALLEKLEEISQRQQNEVAIVTVNSLDGKTAQAYADDYYDYNGYGYGENDDGILLLISMGERKWAISTYGYCHLTAFTDAGISYISNEFQMKLSSGKYAQAFDCFADLCDQFLTQAATGEPYDVGNMPSGHVAPFWLFVDILIGFLISFFMVRRKAGSLKSVVKQDSAKAYTREGSMTSGWQVISSSTVSLPSGAFSGDTPTSSHPPLPEEVLSYQFFRTFTWRKQRFLLTDSRKVLMKQKNLLF